jgi:hypothetical protein
MHPYADRWAEPRRPNEVLQSNEGRIFMPRSHGQARSGFARLTRAALVASLATVALLAFAGTASAATTYYVDCSAGNDSSSGKATGSGAWRSLGRANGATLAPGDRLSLRAGCAWNGPLTAKWNGTSSTPITIGTYGTGAAPVIQNVRDIVQVTGTYLILQDLVTRTDVPSYDAACGNAPTGWRVGFRFYPSAHHNTLRYSTATGMSNGIMVDKGSHHNKLFGNHMIKNNMKDGGSGAIGILVMGDDNEVSYNDISGSDQCSPSYGRDGSAVEIYAGRRNVVHHNTAVDNNNFIELGNKLTSDTTVAYNKVYSSLKLANFLFTRGAGDTSWGPVYGTKVYNNSVYLTGASAIAVSCVKGCNSSVLSLRNNIIVSQDRIGYSDAGFDEGNNLYWQPQGNPKIYFPISSSSRKLDPRWINPGTRDLHLNAGSPAIDTGSMAAWNLGFRIDLSGVAVPRGGAPDIGAYER